MPCDDQLPKRDNDMFTAYPSRRVSAFPEHPLVSVHTEPKFPARPTVHGSNGLS